MKRDFLRIIDKSIAYFIIYLIIINDKFLNIFKKPIEQGETGYKKILAIKIIGLGDTALMLSPLKILSEKYPDSQISVFVTSLSNGILRDQSFIHQIFNYDIFGADRGLSGFLKILLNIRKQNFDCVIDFEHHFNLTAIISYLSGARIRIGFHHNNIRGALFTHKVFLKSNQHMLESFFELLRPLNIENQSTSKLQKIEYSEKDKKVVNNWLREKNISPDDLLIGIHPGSGIRAMSRRWDLHKFHQLILKITARYNAKVIVTGSSSEIALLDEIIGLVGNNTTFHCGGEFNLKQLAALINKCSLFITNDTGPLHISAAMGTKTIGLFGPNLPQRYSPVGKDNVSIYKKVPCSPCINVHKGKVFNCNNPICLKKITVEDVWNEVIKILN